MEQKTKTLKVRVKDRHAVELRRMAREVNQVWNYINELSERSIRERSKFLSTFDINRYTSGCSAELGLHSQTPQMVAAEYVTRRMQFKKSRLNWRKSSGVRRSLGWVPFSTGALKFKDGYAVHRKIKFHVWDSYGLDKYELRAGSFNEDARGRWYLNVVVSFDPELSKGESSVGIDLGCKEAATTSCGRVVVGRWYRKIEGKLKQAQRAKKRKRVQNIHAKAANRRKDALHKFSRELVDGNAAIFVGNVSSKAMSKTPMAKSALDAGWGMLKTMLAYKCDHAGVVFEEVNEAWTSQTCSCCGSRPDSRPKGIAGLGIRRWECGDCGAAHDRDVNAAKNIAALGHERLAGGNPILKGEVDAKVCCAKV